MTASPAIRPTENSAKPIPTRKQQSGLCADCRRAQRALHNEMIEKLGEAGTGVVPKSRGTDPDRFVAIEVLPTGENTRDLWMMFLSHR